MLLRSAIGWREGEGKEEGGRERSFQSIGSETRPSDPGRLVEHCPSSLKTKLCFFHFHLPVLPQPDLAP